MNLSRPFVMTLYDQVHAQAQPGALVKTCWAEILFHHILYMYLCMCWSRRAVYTVNADQTPQYL
jgi:hypothetical protein